MIGLNEIYHMNVKKCVGPYSEYFAKYYKKAKNRIFKKVL
jgi:hypothetical protein